MSTKLYKGLIRYLFVLGLLVSILCTVSSPDLTSSSSNNGSLSLGSVLTVRPDSTLSIADIIKNGKDSATVTINDSLFFVGYITDTSLISKLKANWIFNDEIIDSGFGVSVHAFDTIGRFVSYFVISDNLENSDTSKITIVISNETPSLNILTSDTIINLDDSLSITFLSQDDGIVINTSLKITGDSVADTTFSYLDTTNFVQKFINYGENKLTISVMDDDSNTVTKILNVCG